MDEGPNTAKVSPPTGEEEEEVHVQKESVEVTSELKVFKEAGVQIRIESMPREESMLDSAELADLGRVTSNRMLLSPPRFVTDGTVELTSQGVMSSRMAVEGE